ncbi:MAG TPA: AarF/UbiB family protein [Caulobacteraceae bacterium]|jgi:predicted unusual protein kinase regulating ubiquinone biosynthesis (AarF/ABC1/UbiB family)
MALDPERDRLSGRIGRTARVGAGLAGAGVSYGVNRLFAGDDADARNARLIKQALGNMKGPLMKVAQMVATVPDLLPPEFAEEFAQLQTNAPAMGAPFVRRRMAAELGPDWRARFGAFEMEAAAAASLGQVHRATAADGRPLAVKLQYPDMQSAVESDLSQMRGLMALGRTAFRYVDTSEIAEEVTERLREELDYAREAKHMALYRAYFADDPGIEVPEPLFDLSTGRLLTMTWLEGRGLLQFKDAPLEIRNAIARKLTRAWWGPLLHIGVIHGDPHLGNYTVTEGGERLNLLDFGCIRIFPPRFVAGVVKLRAALMADDREGQAEAYRQWGFKNLGPELLDTMNMWARFIYGPLIDDRVRTIADGISPAMYGRQEAFAVKKALKDAPEPVVIPREFVFLDRAAIGLGAAFLHLGAELNWCELFEEQLAGFDEAAVTERQAAALATAGLG